MLLVPRKNPLIPQATPEGEYVNRPTRFHTIPDN